MQCSVDCIYECMNILPTRENNSVVDTYTDDDNHSYTYSDTHA